MKQLSKVVRFFSILSIAAGILILVSTIFATRVERIVEAVYYKILGADKKFVWEKAKIKGNKVEVWNDNISNPVAVRYAWADNPESANLYNKEGLPASPFRTDD